MIIIQAPTLKQTHKHNIRKFWNQTDWLCTLVDAFLPNAIIWKIRAFYCFYMRKHFLFICFALVLSFKILRRKENHLKNLLLPHILCT